MRFNLFIITFLVLTITSCKKNTSGFVDDISSFDVNPRTLTVSINDSVRFDLSGNPDVISFYSGEIGRVYDFRNRTVLNGGSLLLKFETRVINRPADTLDVLVSSNFSGIYDSVNVVNATWKSLNNKLLFPMPSTPLNTFIPSGLNPGMFLNITDSLVAGQPFYLAFRYTILRTNNIEWSVGKLGVYNIFTNGTPNATVIDSTNNNTGGFVPVALREPTRWSRTSTLYKCLNSSTAVIGAQHYYISRPLNPNAVNPDAPIGIKNISQNPLKYFAFKYSMPGTYKVAFVASNARLEMNQSSVKEFTIIVQ
jgi:hypothetical protein